MTSVGSLSVSERGRVGLPADARCRWGLTDGGEVVYLDLGGSVLLLPGRVESLRRELLEAVDERDWRSARAGFGDPELATQ